jgi:hypothetical protein
MPSVLLAGLLEHFAAHMNLEAGGAADLPLPETETLANNPFDCAAYDVAKVNIVHKH